ncbi:hypothetical protein AB0K20_24430 [Micromonospora matsumotoense]|uniref:hypothetical protein n=1 Tax=Micromonospora matsumotoense TaxID=121616 RepID=UPI00341CD54A
MWAELTGVDVVATGRAGSTDLAGTGRRSVSFYADPVAWLVVEAVEAALASAEVPVATAVAETGMLCASTYATRHTMRSVVAGAARGRVSPLRFAGANPGSLAGLPCILFGLRGPSLLLTMPPETARPVMATIADAWLRHAGCQYVIVSEHQARADETHSVTCLVVRRHRS